MEKNIPAQNPRLSRASRTPRKHIVTLPLHIFRSKGYSFSFPSKNKHRHHPNRHIRVANGFAVQRTVHGRISVEKEREKDYAARKESYSEKQKGWDYFTKRKARKAASPTIIKPTCRVANQVTFRQTQIPFHRCRTKAQHSYASCFKI